MRIALPEKSRDTTVQESNHGPSGSGDGVSSSQASFVNSTAPSRFANASRRVGPWLSTPLPTSLEDISGPGVDLDDEALLQRTMDSKSGDIIEALYEGRIELWQGRDSRDASQSEADMGLCLYLGFWTGGGPERIDRLFRQSGLMRGKWDRVHFANGATYGDVCIARTLLQVNDYYSPPPTSTTTRESPTHRPPSTATAVSTA